MKQFRDTEFWITEDGQVWSNRLRRFLSQGCNDGYPSVKLRGEPYAVHILVCEAYHGPKPFEKAQVRHLDGSRNNNHCKNLCWGTKKENVDDMILHGRTNKGKVTGEMNPNAILTNAQAIEVFKMYHVEQLTRKEIAERTGLRYGLVCSIVVGADWSGVTKDCLNKEEILK